MKAKKKPLGIKHKIREQRRREERIGLAIIVATLVTIIFVSGFLINSMLNQPSTNQPINSTSEPKAAIVDHLSLTYPNQTFIQTATNTLKQAGYTAVDYYPGEEITVEFYKNLPTHSYSLIILRVHSAYNPQLQIVGFFSSETYSRSKYVYEQLTDRVRKVTYNYPPSETDPIYFGITSLFVTQSMRGRFHNTIIVTMGCDALRYTDMAEAFIEKGAKVYISWNGSVLASHTDQATIHLLQHLTTEKQNIRKAVEQTMKDVGPDPEYKSLLIAYPEEAWDYTIQNIASNLVTNSVEIQHTALFQKRKPKNL